MNVAVIMCGSQMHSVNVYPSINLIETWNLPTWRNAYSWNRGSIASNATWCCNWRSYWYSKLWSSHAVVARSPWPSWRWVIHWGCHSGTQAPSLAVTDGTVTVTVTGTRRSHRVSLSGSQAAQADRLCGSLRESESRTVWSLRAQWSLGKYGQPGHMCVQSRILHVTPFMLFCPTCHYARYE